MYSAPYEITARRYNCDRVPGGKDPVFEPYTYMSREQHNYKILVWGIDEDWTYDGRGPKLRMSKGTLQFPDRIIVIPTNMVPAKIAELLAPVTVDSTKKTLGL